MRAFSGFSDDQLLYACACLGYRPMIWRTVLPGWRGYVLSWLALVWIVNIYMSLFGRLRLDIRHERLEIENTQKESQSTAASRKRADA